MSPRSLPRKAPATDFASMPESVFSLPSSARNALLFSAAAAAFLPATSYIAANSSFSPLTSRVSMGTSAGSMPIFRA